MQTLTNDTFGPLVAYLVPGATVLIGIRPWVPIVDGWFTSVSSDAPTLGGFLFFTVAALSIGMTVSAIRWVFVDTLHAWSSDTTPTRGPRCPQIVPKAGIQNEMTGDEIHRIDWKNKEYWRKQM